MEAEFVDRPSEFLIDEPNPPSVNATEFSRATNWQRSMEGP